MSYYNLNDENIPFNEAVDLEIFKKAKKILNNLDKNGYINIGKVDTGKEFNGYKNRLSSKLKLYYSEFKHGIDIIQSDSDKAQFLKDQLNDIFKILMDSDIKLK